VESWNRRVAAIPLTLGAVFVIMMITDRVFDRITLGRSSSRWGSGGRCHHRHRVHGGEDGGGNGSHPSRGLCLEPHRSANACRDAGNRNRFLPVGFARSTAGEYAGNIFWIVGFSLIASWIVAVVFTPISGKLLPEIKTVKGGHAGIYSTPGYQRFAILSPGA
jgi:hypothetical protein